MPCNFAVQSGHKTHVFIWDMLITTMRTFLLFFWQWAGRQRIVHPARCSQWVWYQQAGRGKVTFFSSSTATAVFMTLHVHCAESKRNYCSLQPLWAKPTRSRMATTQFWMHVPNARGVETKLMFAVTAASKTVVSINAVMDDNYTVLKAHGQCGVMLSSNSSQGTNRHEAFLSFPYSFRWLLWQWGLRCIVLVGR